MLSSPGNITVYIIGLVLYNTNLLIIISCVIRPAIQMIISYIEVSLRQISW